MNKKISVATALILMTVFGYAAIVKGINIKLFQSQMLQSPLLPESLVPFLSYFVPIIEIIVALLLTIERTRLWGLLLAYGIMLTFSGYLIILVTIYKNNMPCACGGILGQMGYLPHIIFNIALTIFLLIAICTYKGSSIELKQASSY